MTQSINLSLALQGGGSHGAFTWGVLDRLLEEDSIHISHISGTSAGAINAAIVACGIAQGGPQRARELMHVFWEEASDQSWCNPFNSFGVSTPGNSMSPFTWMLNAASNFLSPYQLNPFNIDPMRELVEKHIDFAAIRACRAPDLYISATNIRSNKLRIFTSPEMTSDMLLASTCLPRVHQSVQIDGEHYWDGGYMGNPVLEPLIYHADTDDLMIVQVNPTERSSLPLTADEISDRLSEITFNAGLMREIRHIAIISQWIEEGRLKDSPIHKTNLHLISANAFTQEMSPQSKLDTSWSFLQKLFHAGRQHTEQWLQQHGKCLGERSSLDLDNWLPSYPWRHASARSDQEPST